MHVSINYSVHMEKNIVDMYASELFRSSCRVQSRCIKTPPHRAELAFSCDAFSYSASAVEAMKSGNIFIELKLEIGFSILSYINKHLALMLPYLLHKTNALSPSLALCALREKLFYPPDDDLINLCVHCEASVCSFIIRDGRGEVRKSEHGGGELCR